MVDVSINVESFSDSGDVIFSIDAGDCLDSTGTFEFEYVYEDEDGIEHSVSRSTYWPRTHDSSTYSLEENLNLSSGEKLTEVYVDDASIEADCYSSSEGLIEPNFADDEVFRASLGGDIKVAMPEPKLGPEIEFVDVDAIIFSRINAAIKKRFGKKTLILRKLNGKSNAKFGKPDINYEFIASAAEPVGEVERGMDVAVASDPVFARNNTSITRSVGAKFETTTRIGASTSLDSTVVSSRRWKLQFSMAKFGLSTSDERGSNHTLANKSSENWSKEIKITEDRVFDVPARTTLEVKYLISTGQDSRGYVGILLVDGTFDYMIHVRKSKYVKPKRGHLSDFLSEKARTIKIKGRLFNVSRRHTHVEFNEIPIPLDQQGLAP